MIRIFIYILYRLGRYIWTCILDRFISDHHAEAEVFSIFSRGKIFPLDMSRGCDFWLWKPRPIHIEDILRDPNWSIYIYDDDYAYLVHLPETHTFYDSKIAPFHYLKIFQDAKRVARIPLFTFCGIGKQLAIDFSQKNVVYFTNTARSGSTLLAKMLQVNDGKTTVFAEADFTGKLAIDLQKKRFPDEVSQSLSNSLFSFVCRNQQPGENYIFKTRGHDVVAVDQIKRFMPTFKHIFLYRMLKSSLESMQRMAYADKIFHILLPLCLKCPKPLESLVGHLSAVIDFMDTLPIKTTRDVMFAMYGIPMASFLKFQSHFDHYLTYEHLLAESEAELGLIYKICGISQDFVSEGLESLKHHSQEGTPLDKQKTSKVEPFTMDEADLRSFKLIGAKLDLPESFMDTFKP